MMRAGAVQRVRVTHGVGGPLVYASVLDMGRLWERLLRRARVPLAYSQGFNPHPRIQIGSPLPVGYSSACELVDVWLSEPMPLAEVDARVREQLPAGLCILGIVEVPLNAVSAQAAIRAAHYRVRLWSNEGCSAVQVALERLLGASTIPRQRLRKGRMADYDLRPLVHSLELVGCEDDACIVHMVLSQGPSGSGRPEEVVAALTLGVQDYVIHRTALEMGTD